MKNTNGVIIRLHSQQNGITVSSGRYEIFVQLGRSRPGRACPEMTSPVAPDGAGASSCRETVIKPAYSGVYLQLPTRNGCANGYERQ